MKETQIQIDGVLIDVLKNLIAKFTCETTPNDIIALHQAYTLLHSQAGAIDILTNKYGKEKYEKIKQITNQIAQFAYEAAPYANLIEKASKNGAEWKDFEKARQKAEKIKPNIYYIQTLMETFYTLFNQCNANRFTIGNDIYARYQKYGKTYGTDKKPYYQERTNTTEERRE